MTDFERNCDDQLGKGSKWAAVAKTPEPEMPELEEVVVQDEPINITESVPVIEDNLRAPAVMPRMAVQVEQPAAGRELLAKSTSDYWNNAEVQKSLPDDEAARLVDNQELLGKNPIKGVVKVLFGKKSNANGG